MIVKDLTNLVQSWSKSLSTIEEARCRLLKKKQLIEKVINYFPQFAYFSLLTYYVYLLIVWLLPYVYLLIFT